MNIVANLIWIGVMLGYIITYAIAMAIGRITDNIEQNKEVQLLNKKKAPFVMDYIQFKKELNCWKETKIEYKL